jgi:hypothetical protein
MPALRWHDQRQRPRAGSCWAVSADRTPAPAAGDRTTHGTRSASYLSRCSSSSENSAESRQTAARSIARRSHSVNAAPRADSYSARNASTPTGTGVVRLPKPSGHSAVVATFSMAPTQREMRYSVSRDGGEVVSGVLTAPDEGPPVLGAPSLVGPWKFGLERAAGGRPNPGLTRVLQHVESADRPDTGPTVDWKPRSSGRPDGGGPVAMVGAPLTTQNVWRGGPLFSLDLAGQRVAGDDCMAAAILPSGQAPYIDTAALGSSVTVRDYAGHALWRPAVEAATRSGSGSRRTPAQSRSTKRPPRRPVQSRCPDGFHAEDLSYVRLDSPTVVHDRATKPTSPGCCPATEPQASSGSSDAGRDRPGPFQPHRYRRRGRRCRSTAFAGGLRSTGRRAGGTSRRPPRPWSGGGARP